MSGRGRSWSDVTKPLGILTGPAGAFSKGTPRVEEGHTVTRKASAPPGHEAQARKESEASTKLEAMYAEFARFVWLTLQRLGVRAADLDDVCHDVFVIVQRKLPKFRPDARREPWLFAICARTAANYRRRAYVRLERSSGALNGDDEVVAVAPEFGRPDHELSRRRALKLAESILQRMGPLKRAVFIMFEVEGMSCQDIATELGLPVGTVYSRLHSARQFFLQRATRHAPPGTGSAHD